MDKVDISNFIIHSVRAALAATSPRKMVHKTICDLLARRCQDEPIAVFALGKASLSMFEGLCDVVGSERIAASLVISHQVDNSFVAERNTRYCYAPHPILDENSFIAGKHAINFFQSVEVGTRLVCLISGGGSSMMAFPHPPMSFDEKKDLLDKIIMLGIPEREVNEIRKVISAVKGGKLLAHLPATRVDNIFLSDERAHKFDAISSGPTVDEHPFLAKKVVKKFQLGDLLPENVLALIEDDPKVPQNRVGVFNHVCGTRSDVLNAFEVILKEKGDFTSINIDHNPIHSIGPEAAMDILSQRYNSFTRDAALGKHIIVIPTEIQISVKKGSLGGRNQHLAALIQARLNFDLPFCFVGFATDGVDFLDGVQGAFCNTTNKIMSALDRAKLEHAIKFTSTHNWHAEQKTLITGGKTGHNVSDFAIFVFEKR